MSTVLCVRRSTVTGFPADINLEIAADESVTDNAVRGTALTT